ncbi:MAG TPA: hypothetical protein VFM10_10550 [Terriglobales bacterium]|jgi:hypothetical protein|nr:hypothetical protein [Terriglobales bacterium]
MRTIHEVLKEKEERLNQKRQEIKALELQIAQLRGAIDIMKEEDHSEPDLLQLEPLQAAPARATTQQPSRNWP